MQPDRALSDRVERARAVVVPHRGEPGVIGAYLSGSGARPYADAHSDLDVYLVLEDAAYNALPPRERYVREKADELDVDVVRLSFATLEHEAGSRCDGVPAMCRHALVLFDTDGRVEALLARVSRLEDAEPRLRIAYRELAYTEDKANKTRSRGGPLANARLLETAALDAARKILFVAAGQRPPRIHWAVEELRLAGIPSSVVDAWQAAVTSEAPDLAAVREAIEGWLTSLGHTFHKDPAALMAWVGFTAEGKAARERYSQVL